MKHWDTEKLLVDDPLSVVVRTPNQHLKLVTNNNHIITLDRAEMLKVWEFIGKVKCLQCGHVWRPKEFMPYRCANRECLSRNWYKPHGKRTLV